MLYISEDQILACAIKASNPLEGVSRSELETFASLLEKNIDNANLGLQDIHFIFPSSTKVFSSDYWREYYEYKDGKYYRRPSLKDDEFKGQISSLKITVPSYIVDESIEDFKNFLKSE